MGTGAGMRAELTAGLGGAAVAAELPQILGPPPCSSPSVLHLSPEPGTGAMGGEVVGAYRGVEGAQPPSPQHPGGSADL